MNWKGTAALVAVAAALGGYAYFVESKKDAPPSVDTQEVQLWDTKKDTTLDRLLVEDLAASKSAEYTKVASDWHYAPKATDSLDSFNWTSPYDNLATLTASRKVEDNPKNLADYGLDKPTMTIHLGTKAKPDLYRVLVGGKSPLDSAAYYARINDDPAVYEITSYKVEGWQRLVSSPPIAKPTPTPMPAPKASAAAKK